MQPSTISVVIPVKNDAPMLERCLAALGHQRRPADEIIVVDNGSTDDTAAVAHRYGVTVITESLPGITAAASAGYDYAQGSIIARCDADSVVPPNWLSHIESSLAEHPEAVAVTGRGTFYDLSAVANWLAQVLYMRAYFFAAGSAIANVPLFGSNFAIRTDAWRAVSAQVPRDNPLLHDDFDLSYRLPPTSRVLYDRDLVVGISGRPFRDTAAMRRRIAMARVTMREHMPAELPTRRWWRRLRTPPVAS